MSAGNWTTIESDPGVFTELIARLGVKGVQVRTRECVVRVLDGAPVTHQTVLVAGGGALLPGCGFSAATRVSQRVSRTLRRYREHGPCEMGAVYRMHATDASLTGVHQLYPALARPIYGLIFLFKWQPDPRQRETSADYDERDVFFSKAVRCGRGGLNK